MALAMDNGTRLSACLALSWVALCIGCRKSDSFAPSLGFPPATAGSSGCIGPDQAFSPGQVPAVVPLAVLSIGPMSQVTAAGDAEVLYATGNNATLVEIDFTGGSPPVETEILTAGGGAVATLLASFGLAGPPVLSGLAVLDAGTLVAMEHSANILIAISRSAPDAVALLAGAPGPGGFADGPLTGPGSARFSFGVPAQLVSLDNGQLLVADSGNHAIRLMSGSSVITIAGTGSAFFSDGELDEVGFDTPVGMSVDCVGQLLVAERGGNGGGHRLRQLLTAPSPFGFEGMVTTRAGAGLDGTMQGDGENAWLGAPASPLVTSEDDVYWIDHSMGILRRMTGATDTVDCPLFASCADAVAAGGNFSDLSAGGAISLTQTPGGVLYVLDAAAGLLLRVTP